MPPSRVAACVVALLAASVHCSRPTGTTSSTDAAVGGGPAARPTVVMPRYRGAAGMALTFYSDCHCEVDGEDSVHHSKPYVFDKQRGIVRIKDLGELRAGDGGVLTDVDVQRPSNLWEKLDDRGRWVPSSARTLDLPSGCTCSGEGCTSFR